MYLEKSKELTGYRVKVWTREAFRITGFTIIVPPGRKGGEMIKEFWRNVVADGRFDRLTQSSVIPPTVLGLGSWDPECPQKGQSYTICIEETEQTDFTSLRESFDLFTKKIGASEWLCFELSEKNEHFWKDNPYKMMKTLGYSFNDGSYDVGLHFDVYPPGFDSETNPQMEFWITVVKD